MLAFFVGKVAPARRIVSVWCACPVTPEVGVQGRIQHTAQHVWYFIVIGLPSLLNIMDRQATEHRLPVPIFQMIAEFGLDLEFCPLKPDISGWIERQDNGCYRIVVNSTHSTTRKRFTAAHELAHFVFHRELLGKGISDDLAYRPVRTRLPNDRINPHHERQANNVAANILMPSASIARLQKAGITDPRALAHRFVVSEAAMRIRLFGSTEPHPDR